MNTANRLIVAHSIMDERILEARRERMLHGDRTGQDHGPRVLEAVRNAVVALRRGLANPNVTAGAHSR